jgi:hypothetical protein
MSADCKKLFGWNKMPAVIVQGPLNLDEQALTNLEFVGLPLSPADSAKPSGEQLADLFSVKEKGYPNSKSFYVWVAAS